jgi:orotidine-5'-phosphate decarboxylase
MPNPILCAIDTADEERAHALVRGLGGTVGGIKLGLEFFVARGPAGVERLAAVMAPETLLFLDLKLHDIPNTVAGAVRAAARLRPALLTIHCSGGRAMMAAAAAAAAQSAAGGERMRILGITVLTSLDQGDLAAIGQQGGVADQVLRLAALARSSGLDGVVCSPHEVAALRAVCGPDFLLVVPGIRPTGAGTGDQKRVMSPAAALAAGADHLVIGRPITEAADPAAAAAAILAEIR